VHQGNGTARAFEFEPRVFTLLRSTRTATTPSSSAPISTWGCPTMSAATIYNAALRSAGSQRVVDFEPQLVIYLAGADPYVARCDSGSSP
jgi:acetoin utilization deacetylase AcuC-like enzyme